MILLPVFNKNKPKKSSDELYNLIYLGTKGIDFGLCQLENGKFKILDVESNYFKDFVVSDLPDIKLEEIRQAIRKLLEKSAERTGKQTRKTIIGIPALYTLNQTTTLRIKRDDPTAKINKKELEEINVRILANSRLEAEKKLNADQDNDLEVVNSDFSFIKLDGYLTKDIENMRGSVLEISQFSSFSSKQYLDNIVRLLGGLKLDLITVTSSIYSLAKYIKENTKIENYMIINFGGHTTDVGIVFGSELINTSSIRIGTESMLSYVSAKVERDRERVLEDLKKEGAEGEEKQIQLEFENFWLESLIESLNSLEGVKIYPNEIMIYGDPDLSIDKLKVLAQLEKLKFKDTPNISNAREKIDTLDGSPVNLQSLGNFIENI